MNNFLKEDLQTIVKDLTESRPAMADFFWSRLKERLKNVKKDEETDEINELVMRIFVTFVYKSWERYEELQKGEISAGHEDLDKLEANFKEILETEGKLTEKKLSQIDGIVGYDGFFAKAKEKREESKGPIQVLGEFADLWDQFDSFDEENFSWLEVKKIYEKAKQKAAVSRPKESAETAEMARINIFGKIVDGAHSFVTEKEKIPSNAWPSTHEELNFLQEIADEFPKIIAWLEKKRALGIKNPEEFSRAKENNEKLKLFIQQQRKKLGSSSTSQPKKPNPQDQQKIQSQEREIDYLKQQLAELQIRIEELMENQNNSTDDQIASQETQQKIETLQNKKQEIQTELKQKQSQQKELKDKVNSQINSPSPDKFNWLWVVIPGGFLLVIAGIVIACLIGKKNKKEWKC